MKGDQCCGLTEGFMRPAGEASETRWMFLALCLIWGLPYLLIRVAVRDVPPGALVFCRCFIGGLILLGLPGGSAGMRVALTRWRPIALFAILEIVIPWFCLADAERDAPSSVSGLFVAAVPIVGAVASGAARTDHRIGLVRGLGLVLGAFGVILLVGFNLDQLECRTVIELTVVVAGYATAPIVMARELRDVPSSPVIALSLLGTAIFYLPLTVMDPPVHVTVASVASVLALGTVCTALAFAIFFRLVQARGPARALLITYINPAVAVLLGVIALQEPIGLGLLVGFLLVMLGAVLAGRTDRVTLVEVATPQAPLRSGEGCSARTWSK